MAADMPQMVRHRIDGLEKVNMMVRLCQTVRHRIDGLEISISLVIKN